jgi:hypothetical protein
MTAKTTLMEEHTDVVLAQVPLTWKGATVVHNTKPVGVRNAPICEVVIRRPGSNDIGLKVRNDGSGVYDVHMYNPGYGNDTTRMVNEMEELYKNYCIATAQKEVKRNGQQVHRTTKPVRATMDFGNGEEACVMVEIHINDGTTSSNKTQKDQSAATGGYN